MDQLFICNKPNEKVTLRKTEFVLRYFLFILTVSVLFSGFGPQAKTSIPTLHYRIVARYPHSPEAFTQGLEMHNGVLFESTGLHGRTSVRKVDLQSGAVMQINTLPDNYFGEGITLLDGKIFQLTWQSYTGFLYDAATLTLMDRFNYSWEGWGMTHDENNLIISDGTETIHFVDPQNYEEVGEIKVTANGKPVMHLNELELVGNRLFANIWPTDSIAVIDIHTGEVTAWLDFSGIYPRERRFNDDVLNGIAYIPAKGTLLITGKLWDTLFEIELVE